MRTEGQKEKEETAGPKRLLFHVTPAGRIISPESIPLPFLLFFFSPPLLPQTLALLLSSLHPVERVDSSDSQTP